VVSKILHFGRFSPEGAVPPATQMQGPTAVEK
jgi:hypothetical protein